MCPSLIEIGSKMADGSAQTDTTKIMVTWPWTNILFSVCHEQPSTKLCHYCFRHSLNIQVP